MILGPDDNRKIVDSQKSSYSRIVLIRAGFDTNEDGDINLWTQGTGFMTGNDVMVTAGHVMWHTKKKMYPKQLRIYLKQSGKKLNSKYYLPKRWTMSKAYTDKNNSKYDWCVVELKKDLGKLTGYFGYGIGNESISKKI